MTNETFPLVKYDAMCSAIAECLRVDEVKELRDKARALEVYAKQAMNVDAERMAAQVRIRAEARTGELLQERARATHAERSPGRGGKQTSLTVGHVSPYAQALADNRIPRQTADRYQALALVPAATLERALAEPGVPTVASVMRCAEGQQPIDSNGPGMWLWGRLRDIERRALLDEDPEAVFAGMTETMQADVLRVLPALLRWLEQLDEVTHAEAR